MSEIQNTGQKQDSEPVSLLDIIQERTQTINKNAFIHRIIYIGKLRHFATHEKLEDYYIKLLKINEVSHGKEAITGMLLVYPEYCIHLIECDFNNYEIIINDLIDNENGKMGYISVCRFIMASSNTYKRVFSQWSCHNIIVDPLESSKYVAPSSSVDDIVLECTRSLLKIGRYLAKIPKSNITSELEHLQENVPSLVIDQGYLECILRSPQMCSALSYQSRNSKIFDITLDSDTVWPIPEKPLEVK